MDPSKKVPTYDYLFKLLLIGDSAVGKSTLLERFSENVFNPAFITTIGIDFKIKTLELDGKRYKLQIWDTAGQERFRTITTAYYRGAMGVIVIFDLNNRKSFDNVRNWIQNINDNMNKIVPIILVGNKCDLPKAVSDQEVNNYVKDLNLTYFETSAKSGVNVKEPFLSMTRACINQYIINGPVRVDPDVVRPGEEKPNRINSKCCTIM